MTEVLVRPQPKPFARDDARYEAVAQRLERAADALRTGKKSPDLLLLVEAANPFLWSTRDDSFESAKKLFAELICSRCEEGDQLFWTVNKEGICLSCASKEEENNEQKG